MGKIDFPIVLIIKALNRKNLTIKNKMSMKKLATIGFVVTALCLTISCGQPNKETNKLAKNENANIGEQVPIQTSDDAINALKSGNKRFVESILINTDYKKQIEQTKTGQKPHSVILSCMDSRVPPEIIFDQGIGNIFVIRVAGNIEDENVLGSMEYAVEHSGSKLIVVMGHNHCGAVTGAVKDIKLGNLTQLVEQIKPAIKSDPNNPETIDETAKNSVQITIADILKNSTIISEMVKENKIAIVGAFYDIETGVVSFTD
jgi:carbonic anhydrase